MKMLTIPIQVDGHLRDVIEISNHAKIEEYENAAKEAPKVIKFIEGKAIHKIVVVPRKLVNIITILPLIHRRCDRCGTILNDFDGKQIVAEYRITNPAAQASKYPHDFRFCSVKCLSEEMSQRNEYDDLHDWRAASGIRYGEDVGLIFIPSLDSHERSFE